MEDREIVALYFARNEEAIRHTAEKYGTRLRTLSRSIVRDDGVAEECENGTYLEAWNAIPPHAPEDYLFAFLARITRHLSLDVCRHRDRAKRNAVIAQLDEEMASCLPDTHGEPIDDMILRDVLNTYLRSLDEEKRAVFVRRYWYLDPICDIAARFALSEGKVKTILFRCRKELRKILEKEGYSL